MLKTIRLYTIQNKLYTRLIRKQSFLTNAYSCNEAWNARGSSPILNKININDFYNIIDQNYTTKGVISATDVDIFANAIKDSGYLDELRDLIHKLRLSAETGATLESTHHAVIRNYINFGNISDLLEILKNPLSYGIFLDDYTANLLLNKLVTSNKYEEAATVASLIMLQEDYSNPITCTICQYACYKFIQTYTPPVPVQKELEAKKKKVEEIKIRIKFLRNPYFDDHFDIKETILLSGKTLAWISEQNEDNLNNNLEIIGWLYYRKFDKLLASCEQFSNKEGSKIFSEVKDLLQQEFKCENIEVETVANLEKCLFHLSKTQNADTSLEEALKVSIENAINKTQKQDIANQIQLFSSWAEIRETKLNEQIKRLDRAKRVQLIQEKQIKMKEEEQKLWFFENEDQIDLQIEEKEELVDKTSVDKSTVAKSDDNYIPPEILPKRK